MWRWVVCYWLKTGGNGRMCAGCGASVSLFVHTDTRIQVCVPEDNALRKTDGLVLRHHPHPHTHCYACNHTLTSSLEPCLTNRYQGSWSHSQRDRVSESGRRQELLSFVLMHSLSITLSHHLVFAKREVFPWRWTDESSGAAGVYLVRSSSICRLFYSPGVYRHEVQPPPRLTLPTEVIICSLSSSAVEHQQSRCHASLWLLRSTGNTSLSPHLDWHPHMACLSGVMGSAHDLPVPAN